jgi:hypothetical protein
MTKNNITWAPLISLIGGMPLGAEKAFGKPPEAIYSYDGFQSNDSHYVNHMNTVRGNNLDYVLIDEKTTLPRVDVVCGTPPLKLAA